MVRLPDGWNIPLRPGQLVVDHYEAQFVLQDPLQTISQVGEAATEIMIFLNKQVTSKCRNPLKYPRMEFRDASLSDLVLYQYRHPVIIDLSKVISSTIDNTTSTFLNQKTPSLLAYFSMSSFTFTWSLWSISKDDSLSLGSPAMARWRILISSIFCI